MFLSKSSLLSRQVRLKCPLSFLNIHFFILNVHFSDSNVHFFFIQSFTYMKISIMKFIFLVQKQISEKRFQILCCFVNTFLKVRIVCTNKCISEIPRIFRKNIIGCREAQCSQILDEEHVGNRSFHFRFFTLLLLKVEHRLLSFYLCFQFFFRRQV